MAKGPEITDELKAFIYKVHEQHPAWTNQEIRNWVLAKVHENKPSLPKEWPSKYVIDRIMPKIREQVKQSKLNPNPIDGPWSTTTLAQYPIPPEALPHVLDVWAWTRINLHRNLTIREIQWAARLYALGMPDPVLSFHCRTYAATEKIYEQTGAALEPWPAFDADLFVCATKQEITPDQLDKILTKDELEEKMEVRLSLSEVEWPKGAQKGERREKEAKNETVRDS